MDQSEPLPPYDVVIFSGKIRHFNDDFLENSNKLYEQIKQEEGFIGADVIRNEENEVVVHYYWEDLNTISIWDKINDFMNEKEGDQMKWFEYYKMKIGRIEREFEVYND